MPQDPYLYHASLVWKHINLILKNGFVFIARCFLVAPVSYVKMSDVNFNKSRVELKFYDTHISSRQELFPGFELSILFNQY